MRIRSAILQPVKSSTLLEVIIAMLISTIVFFFSLTIIINLLGGTKLIRKYYRDITAQSILNEPIASDQLETIIYKEGEVTLHKTISKYNNDPELLLITVETMDNSGKSIFISRRLLKKIN